LNVGAGTGSYEPPGRAVTAVEPSAVMRAQRPKTAAPCIDARAEVLPFADDSFDVALGDDLESRVWHGRNAPLLSLDEVDLGARLLIAGA
jgi:hypothetical protein